MTYAIKVSTAGNSTCLMLPKAAADRLQVEKGDVVYLTEGPDGALLLTTSDPEFAEQMAAAEQVMRQYRNALRELAKK
ncbi:MAG TPA: AbrB/MazE/SpoVT family DNA-binding domain-containing protein [Myxococcota bacterium]|nr:AbrB/MazE/SpoVT family DNA-binding domain-containing protein [Myxococcota bacterium]